MGTPAAEAASERLKKGVKEADVTPNMHKCARELFEAYLHNPGSNREARKWENLDQADRDAWCAAAVAAFIYVAEKIAEAP